MDIVVGIKPYQTGKGIPKQTREIVKQKPFTRGFQVDQTFMPCIVGSNFHRYGFIEKPSMWLKYGEWLAEPRPGAPFFDDEKIIIRQTADEIIAHLDDTKSVNLNNVYNVGRPRNDLNMKYILCVLNSALMKVVYRAISQEKGKLFAEVKKVYLEKLPMKEISDSEQKPFIEKAEIMIAKNEELFNVSSKFLALLKSELGLENIRPKLKQWHLFDFASFVKELKKENIALSLTQKAEWKDYFEQQNILATALKQDIETTYLEIDQMVYTLYNLTPEELDIVKEAAS